VLDARKKILYELKRIKSDVADWAPYLDEASQYYALDALAGRGGYKFRVMAYNRNIKGSYGIYILDDVSNESIKGRKMIMPSQQKSPFISDNRRQQNRNY